MFPQVFPLIILRPDLDVMTVFGPRKRFDVDLTFASVFQSLNHAILQTPLFLINETPDTLVHIFHLLQIPRELKLSYLIRIDRPNRPSPIQFSQLLHLSCDRLEDKRAFFEIIPPTYVSVRSCAHMPFIIVRRVHRVLQSGHKNKTFEGLCRLILFFNFGVTVAFAETIRDFMVKLFSEIGF